MQDIYKLGFIAFMVYLASLKGAGYLSSKVSFPKTQFSFSGLAPFGASLSIRQTIRNNSGIPIPIDAIQGNILYGKNVIGGFASSKAFVIGGNDETVVYFDSTIDTRLVGGALDNLLAEGSFLKALYLQGEAVSKGVVFPFYEKISLLS